MFKMEIIIDIEICTVYKQMAENQKKGLRNRFI